MANPGYGKRSAPSQLPRTNHDFAHLPAREAAVAAYLDRLPDGADISVKTLAKTLPHGQCALGTVLRNLHRAGHLRRGREQVSVSGSPRWITRTWFTRTPRDNDWWATFTRGDVPGTERSAPRPTRSRAHTLLAALSRTDSALSLSSVECTRLAPLVEKWFARGADEEYVRNALTAGLPSPVHHPAALLRRRLTDKLPPEAPPAQTPRPSRPPRRMLECAECGVPGRPEALPGGLCRGCGGEHAPTRPDAPCSAQDVRARAAEIRASMSLRREAVGG